ncbi:MAG: Hsp20/alpha crystallin family protein [Gallionella sp.]|nr:Hsp20/alpha crystallin family protein [Gallionella sp.]
MNLVKWDPFREPDDADENSVKAEFKDGMLNVMLAKSEKAKPMAIEVPVS